MTRLPLQLCAALVVAAAPMASVRAQRASALAAGVTRAAVPRANYIATTASQISVASGQDSKVMKGALIGAGVGAAIGVWVAVAGKSTSSGPDHAADSDSKVIIIPASAVLGGLLGVIVASRL